MSSYLSPGAYVEVALSTVQPITGVGASTAAFIGAASTTGITLGQPIKVKNARVGIGDGATMKFTVSPNPVTIDVVKVNGAAPDSTKVTLSVAPTAPATVTFTTAPAAGSDRPS